jgi:hypothetical protein
LKKIDSKLFKTDMDHEESYMYDKDGSLEIIPGSAAARNNYLMEDVESIRGKEYENPLS